MALEREISLIIGKSGFGKTYLARTLITHYPRVIVMEHRGEYGATPFYDFNALCDFCAASGIFRVSWLGGMDFVYDVFHLAFALRNVLIVVEEADLYPLDSWYYEAVYRGRLPAQISIMALAQRPQLLAPDLRSQASKVYAFNSTEPSALQWLGYFIDDADAVLPALPPKQGIRWEITDHGPVQSAFHLP